MKPGMASALAVVLLVGVGTRSASALDSCSNATLTGSYGFVLTGTILGVGPISIVGTSKYDGAGNFVRNEVTVVNGYVLPPETISGTYSVNADCTGTTADTLGLHSQFVIVNNGKGFFGEGTDGGSVLTVTAQRE